MKLINFKNLQKDIPEIGGMVGYAMLVDQQIDKMLPADLPSWAGPAAKIVLGSGLRTNKSAIVKGIGNAMLVTGANEVAQEIEFMNTSAGTSTTTGVPQQVSNSVNGRI